MSFESLRASYTYTELIVRRHIVRKQIRFFLAGVLRPVGSPAGNELVVLQGAGIAYGIAEIKGSF
jgi:hypothetical protein